MSGTTLLALLPACLSIGAGYLAGSLSSAVLVCRALGHADPRTVGSGNPGATNVLRNFGKLPAALTLLGDLLKGALPVLLVRLLGFAPWVVAGVALAAFLGHLYPVFFRFQGGKGIATFLGCLIALSWPTALAFGGIWLLIAGVSRYSSLAGLIATALTPVAGGLLGLPGEEVVGLCLMAGCVFVRHRANIVKLYRGTESRIGGKGDASGGSTPPAPPAPPAPPG
jgi:glycerol-3-phosphate acyltransferase PlsY